MAERSRWSPAALLEWGLVVCLARTFAWLPESAAYALGVGAGRLAFRLDGRHRAITVENLTRAFPGKFSPPEVEALARAVFENPGRTAVIVVDMQNGFCSPKGFLAKKYGVNISMITELSPNL
ncbi:MAG: hypothetical protein HYU32_07660 [candidate division NC10 bacterium]|nr:hypothetical protein [candidate division NC10 bacterium]